jgi:hypothetical protein
MLLNRKYELKKNKKNLLGKKSQTFFFFSTLVCKKTEKLNDVLNL